MEYFEPGTLVVTPGDREDIILAALSTASLSEKEGRVIAGLVLSGDLFPHQNLIDLIKSSHLAGHRLPIGQLYRCQQHPLDDGQDPARRR